jgi:putative transposase
LLRELEVSRPNQVWCADITYVPMPCGNAYLCAVLDWSSRKVLVWRLSNTMDTSLCLGALEDAIGASGGCLPEVFNTDQGCQFTSVQWTSHLLGLGVAISMDGKGRWMDNILFDRLWRSVKYEEIYLREHPTIPMAGTGLSRWFERYNSWRPHQALGNRTPGEVYTAWQPIVESAPPCTGKAIAA